jgi:hypothetical protein
MSYKKPWLLAIPRRYIVRDWVNEDSSDLLFEVEVTNRGEPTVAKGWTLCLVHEGQPFKYDAESISANELTDLGEHPLSLEESALRTPIAHGDAAAGWLLFHVPKKTLGDGTITGGLECRERGICLTQVTTIGSVQAWWRNTRET